MWHHHKNDFWIENVKIWQENMQSGMEQWKTFELKGLALLSLSMVDSKEDLYDQTLRLAMAHQRSLHALLQE